MQYWEDLQKVNRDGSGLADFVSNAIGEHRASKLYVDAATAYEYFKKRNVTITQYRKVLYM